MYISPYCRSALEPPNFMKFGIRGHLTDVITCVKFLVNRFSGYGVLTSRKWPFPIDLLRRPYNSSHCRATLWWVSLQCLDTVGWVTSISELSHACTHNQSLIRKCRKATMQVNGETGNSTPCYAQTLNRSSPKVAYVVMSWISTHKQNLVTIP